MDLQRNTHHVYRLMYHFVWIPKYRHKVFEKPYREAMKSIIRKIGYDYDFDIQELEITEDHIHMDIKGEPKIAPSHVMQVIKVFQRESFLSYIQRLKNDTSGVVSFGHRAISSKPSVMPMKRQSGNMFKTN
jgi:REP element-mobilizing transposase RayT